MAMTSDFVIGKTDAVIKWNKNKGGESMFVDCVSIDVFNEVVARMADQDIHLDNENGEPEVIQTPDKYRMTFSGGNADALKEAFVKVKSRNGYNKPGLEALRKAPKPKTAEIVAENARLKAALEAMTASEAEGSEGTPDASKYNVGSAEKADWTA